MVFKDDFYRITKSFTYLLRKIIQPKINIMIAGNDLDKNAEEELKKSHIIYSHNFDYDNYLEIRNHKSAIKQNYFIFIDQNLPEHPDMLYRNKKNMVEIDNYWSELSLILNNIKKFKN